MGLFGLKTIRKQQSANPLKPLLGKIFQKETKQTIQLC